MYAIYVIQKNLVQSTVELQSLANMIDNLYELGRTCVVTSGAIVKHETSVQVRGEQCEQQLLCTHGAYVARDVVCRILGIDDDNGLLMFTKGGFGHKKLR